jgi:hypothetical protein
VPGIGQFIVGESQIGSDPFDWRQTLLSQYANSPTILALIETFDQCIDPTTDIDNFFDTVFNVLTAVGFGLDIWGRIVGVGRVFPVADALYFGFEGSDFAPWNQGIWWDGVLSTSNFALADDSYRLLILAKAMSNLTEGSIPAINDILKMLFAGRGNAYVDNHANMTMTYTFAFTLSAVDLTIVVNSGVLPNPTGVTVNVVFA